MNTPAHLLIGAAVFARPGSWRLNAAAVAGALAPDLSLYLMAGTSIFLLDVSPNVVFGQYYFSDAWQSVFAVDNSFVVWSAVLALGAVIRTPWIMVLAGSALLHLAMDFPFHNDDARPHFWPVSDWVFVSPVSYWDGDHYGGIVGPIEVVLCLCLCAVLWRRFAGVPARAAIALGASVQVAPVVMWSFMFS